MHNKKEVALQVVLSVAAYLLWIFLFSKSIVVLLSRDYFESFSIGLFLNKLFPSLWVLWILLDLSLFFLMVRFFVKVRIDPHPKLVDGERMLSFWETLEFREPKVLKHHKSFHEKIVFVFFFILSFLVFSIFLSFYLADRVNMPLIYYSIAILLFYIVFFGTMEVFLEK